MNCGMKLKNKRIMKKRTNGLKLMFTISWLFVLGYCLLFTACKDKAPQDSPVADSLAIDTVAVVDTTLYGRCGEGTAMHTLELITDEGDTLCFGINNDTIACVRGGLGAGDRLAVIVGSEYEGEPQAKLVVNLTTLLGKWTALDKNFELQEGGVVVSNVTEPKPLTEWKICNGHLVLSADTFDIYELGADSLYLENANGIYTYKRMR